MKKISVNDAKLENPISEQDNQALILSQLTTLSYKEAMIALEVSRKTFGKEKKSIKIVNIDFDLQQPPPEGWLIGGNSSYDKTSDQYKPVFDKNDDSENLTSNMPQ